jgi:hypothetical protein
VVDAKAQIELVRLHRSLKPSEDSTLL